MAVVRSEITQTAKRWREALVALAVLALGAYWFFASFGLLSWVGAGLMPVGAVLLWTGVQRARFRIGQGGAGVVQVDERRVTYFGPLSGGSISIDALTLLELEPKSKPVAEWVLTEPGQAPLHIPTTATGAEALFDVFAALDGIKTEAMLAQLQSDPENRVTIWQSAGRRLH